MSIAYIIVSTHETNVHGISRQVKMMYDNVFLCWYHLFISMVNSCTKNKQRQHIQQFCIYCYVILLIFIMEWQNAISIQKMHHGTVYPVICCNVATVYEKSHVDSADNYVEISTPAPLCVTYHLKTSMKETYNYVLCFAYQLCFWDQLFISVVLSGKSNSMLNMSLFTVKI